MSEHDPGPWKAHKTIEAHDGMPECWQIDAEHDAVCTTQFCYALNTQANARLIAAAPELLEALIKMEHFAGLGRRFDDSLLSDEGKALRDAREAISKATNPQHKAKA